MKLTDETTADLVSLIESDFGRLKPPVEQYLLDWLHYRARLIPQRRRTVIVSPEAQAHSSKYPAITDIKRAIEQGDDVSPWLSDSVRKLKKKKKPTADPMFNDWQISHFHLGDEKNDFRSKPVLFAHVSADKAVLLDVQPHGKHEVPPWGMQALLRVLRNASPNTLPEMKGILGSPVSDEEIRQKRKRGSNSLIMIEGKAFIPGGLGITSTRHSTRLGRYADELTVRIAQVRQQIESNTMPPQMRSQLVNPLGPVILGIRFAAGEFVLFEKMRGIKLWISRPLE